MDKVKIGVLGAGRGRMMMKYCSLADNAELVAVCDNYEPLLNRVKEQIEGEGATIAYYTDFDEFLKHDMDAVVVSNYADEHAPFAIKCLKAGKHVLSECLPVETMAQAVELVEAAEASDKMYCFSENYCYMPATREMKKLYREGKLGEFEYGEGEYIHNCENIWPEITQGNPDHWRNRITSTYYCTHSVGPVVHVTGLRPVKVTGFEIPFNARCARMGARGGAFSILMLEMSNGGYAKIAHGLGPSRDSVWYSFYGSKGRMESARDDTREYMPLPGMGTGVCQIYTNFDSYEGENNLYNVETYEPTDEFTPIAKDYGHAGSDFYDMWNFVEKIKGNPEAEVIDVYEALDMGLPGILGYRSILNGNIPIEIPNFRNPLEREKFRHDTTCPHKERAGALWVPSSPKGNPVIDPKVYEHIRKVWEDESPDSLALYVSKDGKNNNYYAAQAEKLTK